jgi:hypothetical protein
MFLQGEGGAPGGARFGFQSARRAKHEIVIHWSDIVRIGHTWSGYSHGQVVADHDFEAVCGRLAREHDERVERVAAVRLYRPDMQEQVHLGRGQRAVIV